MRHHEYISELDGPQSRVIGGRRILAKGGNGGQAYYANAEKLYGVQADSAQFMLDLGQQYVPGALTDYAEQASKYGTQEYVDRMTGAAATDAASASTQAQAAMKRDMARYGLNPASGRFGNAENVSAIEAAKLKAGAVNAARTTAEDKAYGASKDFYNNLVGMPSDAASSAGSAASGFASMGASKDDAAAQEAAGWGSAVGMGIGAYSAFAKDGGAVRMAEGGLLPNTRGLTRSTAAPPPQPTPMPAQSPQGAALQSMQTVKGAKNTFDAVANPQAVADKALGKMSTGAAQAADLTGSAAMQETALNAAGASGAVAAEGSQVGMLAAQNAGLDGAVAATTEALGAGSAAAGEAALATSPALAGVSAALPWVGAAVALGSMFGLFADGGEVGAPDEFSPEEMFKAKANLFQAMFNRPYHGTPEEDGVMQRFAMSQLNGMDPDGAVQNELNMRRGGEVAGPGTKTSDSIPARLSDGEYVVNADSVEVVGTELLDAINNLGLRRRYGDERIAA